MCRAHCFKIIVIRDCSVCFQLFLDPDNYETERVNNDEELLILMFHVFNLFVLKFVNREED